MIFDVIVNIVIEVVMWLLPISRERAEKYVTLIGLIGTIVLGCVLLLLISWVNL